MILIGGALISKLLDSQAAPAAGYGNGYQQRGDYGQEQFQGARLKRQVDESKFIRYSWRKEWEYN